MRAKTRLMFAIGAALSFGAALATTMEALGLDRIVEESSVAVMGEVTASRVEQTAEGPYTLATLRVEEALWGTSDESITVAVPGGTQQQAKFRVGTVVPGAPNLLIGSDVVVFLRADGVPGTYEIVGFSQGVVDVAKGPEGDTVVLPGEAVRTRWAEASARLKELRAAARARQRDRVSR